MERGEPGLRGLITADVFRRCMIACLLSCISAQCATSNVTQQVRVPPAPAATQPAKFRLARKYPTRSAAKHHKDCRALMCVELASGVQTLRERADIVPIPPQQLQIATYIPKSHSRLVGRGGVSASQLFTPNAPTPYRDVFSRTICLHNNIQSQPSPAKNRGFVPQLEPQL